MFDMLSALHPRGGVTFTGYYYPRRPNAPDDDHEVFEYEMVDPEDKRFKTIAGNIINSEGVSVTICVREDIDFDVENSYVYLQDGHFYTIESDMKDYSSAPRETFRYFRTSPQVSHVLRLLQVDAPWSEQ